MPYVLTIDGTDYNTDHLTMAEAIAIERDIRAGLPPNADPSEASWVYINPFRSAQHFKAIAAVVLRKEGKNEAEINAYIDGLTMTEALDLVRVEPTDIPEIFVDGLPDPKAESTESGTSTS